MRLAAVILPDLGTGPDVPIVVSHWFAARGTRSGRGNGWSKYWSGPPRSTSPRQFPDDWPRFTVWKTIESRPDRCSAWSRCPRTTRPTAIVATSAIARAAGAGKNRRQIAPRHDDVP